MWITKNKMMFSGTEKRQKFPSRGGVTQTVPAPCHGRSADAAPGIWNSSDICFCWKCSPGTCYTDSPPSPPTCFTPPPGKANRAHAAVPLRRSALNETASEHLSNSRLGLLTSVVRGESAHVTTSGDGLQNKTRRYAIATRAKARTKAT